MTVGHSISINDTYLALDPVPLIEYLKDQGRPYEHVEKCNRFILPVGKEYGRGWILMNASDVVAMRNTAGCFNSYVNAIRFRPSEDGDNTGFQVTKLGISRVYSVTGYNQDYIDSNNAGLADHFAVVEFVDARYSARMTSINKQYNVRSYDVLDIYDSPTFWDDTLNSGVRWTWAQIVQDIIGLLPSSFTASIDISSAQFPNTYPENLKFPGLSAWDALCEILHQTGNAIWRNSNGDWYISTYNNNPFPFTNKVYMEKFLEDGSWDLPRYPLTQENINIPEKIVVYFPTLKNDFQAYADTKLVDGGDVHDIYPLYSLERSVSSSAVTGTKVSLHSPLFATYDEQGNLINSSILASMADNMATLFKAAKGWSSSSRQNVYLYYHNLFCGTDISAVQWYNTGAGSRTEILRNPFKFVPGDEHYELGRMHLNEVLSWENFATTAELRKHNPFTRFAIAKVKDGPSDQDIPPNGVGVARILYGSHSGAGSITWASSGKDIYLHEIYGKTIPKGKKVTCYWHLQTRRWIAVYFEDIPCIPEFHTGTLQYDMCPTENGTSIDLIDICDCTAGCGSIGSGGISVTLKNPFKLAGRAGKKVFVYHTKCGGVGGNQDECVILQVEHEAHELIENHFEHTSGQPCDAQTGQVDPSGICKVYYDYREYSVMTCKSTATQATLFTAERVDALTDWWVDGLEIKGEFTPIWVVCICDPYTVVLHIGTDCAYGSGTGG